MQNSYPFHIQATFVLSQVELRTTMPRRSPPLPTSARACWALQNAALDLLLDNRHLSHSGTKATRAARLWAHLRSKPATVDDATEEDTGTGTDPGDDTTEDPRSN